MELVSRYHSILWAIIFANMFTVSATLMCPIICRYVGDTTAFKMDRKPVVDSNDPNFPFLIVVYPLTDLICLLLADE